MGAAPRRRGLPFWLEYDPGQSPYEPTTVTPSLDHQSEPAQLLRTCGVQVTAQRIAVLRAVAGLSHATADEIAGSVRAEIGAISRQAVYDALGLLVDKGLLQRIQPAGSAARYERRVGDNHHHVVCAGCGRIEDVDCATGAAPCLEAADDHGYEIERAEVVYWGRCAACRRASAGTRE